MTDQLDKDYVLQVLETFGHLNTGGVTEVRIFPPEPYMTINDRREYLGATVSGYYDNYSKLVDDISPFDGKANIYITINPVIEALLARANNRLRYRAKTTTSDDDILCDLWFPIDCDPARPTDISATTKELQAALLRRDEIAKFLSQWAQALLGMSGNGGHGLIRLPGYPNNTETRQARERLTKFLHDRFTDWELDAKGLPILDDKGAKIERRNGVSVDSTVFNLSRIWKLYGTTAVKGEDVEDRPHRRAYLDIPNPIPDAVDLYTHISEIIPQESTQVQEPTRAKKKASNGESKKSAAGGDYPLLDVPAYLNASGVTWRIKEKSDRTWYQFEMCPLHTDDDSDRWECAICQEPSGKMGAKCMHEEAYTWKDFKEELGDPKPYYSNTGEKGERHATNSTEVVSDEPGTTRLKWQDCHFLSYCKENAQTLSEPLWYSMVSTLSRFENEGRQLAHQLSQNCPDYSEAETDKKLNHAKTARHPITCNSIANKGFVCPVRAQCKAKSPAALLKMNTSGEGEKQPTGEELALEFLASEYIQNGILTLRYYQATWWTWNGRCYQEIPKADLEGRIAKFVTERDNCDVTTNLISAALLTLTGQCLIPHSASLPVWAKDDFEVTPAGRIIAFENGLVNLDELIAQPSSEVVSHTPLFINQIALPYPFDEKAECPEFTAFMEHNLDGDEQRIAVLQEFAGYCLSWDTRLHKFLLMEGESRTGKSTFTDVITAMLGEENVANIPLELFGTRFALASTVGKLANIASDVGKLDSVSEGAFKAFVAGDRMNFERKYKDTLFAYPTARMIIATNNRPKFLDRSQAIWKRMLLIEWKRIIPEKEQDLNLRERIKANELSGIFLWALTGLARLLNNGHFTPSTVMDAAISDYQLEVNPAQDFLEQHYISANGGEIFSQEIYNEYTLWCDNNGHDKLDERSFSKEIRRKFPHTVKTRKQHATHGRLRAYVNIRKKRDR